MSINNLTQFKNRIKAVRDATGLTRDEFAKNINVSGAYVGQLESGKKINPSNLFISSVSTKYNINPDWLRFGNGEMKSGDVTYPLLEGLKTADVGGESGEKFVVERVTEGQTEFRIKGRIKGRDVELNSKNLKDQSIIIIDEQHRAMIDLMDSAPQEKNELVALVKGYLMGKKRNKAR